MDKVKVRDEAAAFDVTKRVNTDSKNMFAHEKNSLTTTNSSATESKKDIKEKLISLREEVEN